jgi:rfaE bifunctional protein kinase chain/domain
MLNYKRFQEITQNFNSIAPIFVLGDIGIDKYTLGEVKRISPEAPVPVVEVVKEWTKLGLASNVADNLQSLNIACTLSGVIGDDLNGNLLEGLLEESNLKTWGLVRDQNRMTTFKERVVTEMQQVCRIDYETKTPLIDQTMNKVVDRLQEFEGTHSALIIEDYGKGLLNENLCQKAIKIFKDKNKLVAIDPSRTSNPYWYKGATLLKPNLVEAKIIAEFLGLKNEDNLEKIADLILNKLEIEKLIITLGAKGMAMKSRGDAKLSIIPTAASEVFDVSGAGDTAIATITASLVAGATLEEAAWIGNCASGVVVGKKGTANVTNRELEHFYQKMSQLQL